MAATFDRPSREGWPPGRLDRVLNRIRKEGLIDDVSMRITGAPEIPEVESQEELESGEVVTSAPYVLTYTSEAAAEPVELSGEIELRYDAGGGDWLAHWEGSLLWPGIRGARGFQVSARWSRRAPIVDRAGRAVARGPAPHRRYPFASIGGSTIGHIGPLSTKESRAATGPGALTGPEDYVGLSGLEAAFERRLAGTPSTRLSIVDRKGRRLEVVGRARGRSGRPLRTTLDVDVQRAAEQAFGATVGGSVVIDPGSGDLLAVVSSSPFDPNNYVGVAGITPFNRALSGLYPPGSSMKVVTASAALDSGKVTPQTTVTGPKSYKGVTNFESGQFGPIPFSDALQFSVNTAFAQVAEKLGAGAMTRYARSFGFNHAPEMRLSAASPSFPRPGDLGDLMWGSIGQAQVLATPLQMSTVAATVANEGKRMEPRIALERPPIGARAISRKTARTMTTLMQNVVTGGTGVNAQIPGVNVAGKTGTAEVDVEGERKNHAWFVAFAPAESPTVAVSVVSEYGGIGGQVAAPLAGKILQAVLPLVR